MLNIADILLAYDIRVAPAGDNYIRVLCPFHSDHKPSCNINIKTAAFKCLACSASGDVISLISRAKRISRSDVTKELQQKYGFSTDRILSIKSIEKFHANIWKGENQPLQAELIKRGLTAELISYYRLGVDGDRITIPIKNEAGHYVAIKRYNPGAKTNKMIGQKYRGKNRFYPIEQLTRFKKVLIAGGELKAIIAAYQLNAEGIGVVSGTLGEHNLTMEMAKRLTGYVVYVCMDVDASGEAAQLIIAKLVSKFAEATYMLSLPLDVEKYPTGDINDFVYYEKGNMIDLIPRAKKFVGTSIGAKDFSDTTTEARDRVLSEVATGEDVGKRIRVNGRITMLRRKPFLLPKEVDIQCDKSEAFCVDCPKFHADEKMSFNIPNESVELISMCGASTDSLIEPIRTAIGIPEACRKSSFAPLQHYSLQEVQVSNEMHISADSRDSEPHAAYCLGSNYEANRDYIFSGREYPNPRTQESVMLFSNATPIQDSLSSYVADDLDALKIFQPADWSMKAIKEKLHAVYEDFEANVTHIYQRRRFMLLLDLVYHSPLLFELDGKIVNGWVNGLIVGDSSIGKSETIAGASGTTGLVGHYQLGKVVSCKGATAAGLMGGLVQLRNEWYVTWGVIPLYDKQVVILEELSGVQSGALEALTSMRSSGIAEIPKVKKQQTFARTRLLAVSNPISPKTVGQYTHGVQAISELIKAPEDIRRFDVCLVAASSEITSGKIAEYLSYRPEVAAVHTSDLCRDLVLWAWSRERDQVIFEEEAALKTLIKTTIALTKKYDDMVLPIVDRGSMRYKLAKLSAALAARTYSCSEDMQSIVVRKGHVEFVRKSLEGMYDDKVMAYNTYSESVRYQNNLQEPGMILQALRNIPESSIFLQKLIHATVLSAQDISDWTGYDRIAAQQILSTLVRYNAVKRTTRQEYAKTEQFNLWLRKECTRQLKLVKEG